MCVGSLDMSVMPRRPGMKPGSKKYIQISVFIELAGRIRQYVSVMEKIEERNVEGVA